MLAPVIAALAIRLIVVAFMYPGQLDPRRDHWPFAYETGRIARAIASGRGFSDPLSIETGPTAWMAPVYPYLVAGVFKLFGTYSKVSAIFLLSLDSLFSAMTCVPVYFMARRSFDPRVAVWATWSWAMFPYAILFSADAIWETCLTTLLLSLLFLCALHLEHPTRPAAWMGFGLLWGLAALANPAVLAVLPFLVGWVCYRLQRRGEEWGTRAAAAAVVFLLVLAPWEVRNFRIFHQPVPLRDTFWLEVWTGNHGDTALMLAAEPTHPATSDAEAREFSRLGEAAYMAEKRREALDFITNHPRWFALQTLRRIVFMWAGVWSLPHGQIQESLDPEEPFDPVNIVFCSGLTLLALLGLRRAFRERAETRWLYLLVLASFPLIYYFTRPILRYRHPVEPEMVILGAYAVAAWRRRGETFSGAALPSDEAT